jgi:hypothetical protein
VANEASGGSRARTGARTWPVERARRAFGAAAPGVEFAFPARLREWAVQEVAAGRLLPWFAVSFGAGIVLYFTADTSQRFGRLQARRPSGWRQRSC